MTTTGYALEGSKQLVEQELCWSLHLARHNVREVARRASAELGYSISPATAWRRIEAERIEMRKELRRHAEDERDVELAALDLRDTELLAQGARARARIQQQAEDGEYDDRAEAVLSKALDGLGRNAERRAKLLGLDAPVVHTVDVTHHDAVQDELGKMLADAGYTPTASDGSRLFTPTPETIGTQHDATT